MNISDKETERKIQALWYIFLCMCLKPHGGEPNRFMAICHWGASSKRCLDPGLETLPALLFPLICMKLFFDVNQLSKKLPLTFSLPGHSKTTPVVDVEKLRK